MEPKNYLEDLNEIKSLMKKSSQFLSLSGFAGVFAGIYALIGAGFVKYLLENNQVNYKEIFINETIFWQIIMVAIVVLGLSITTAFYLSYKKANKNNENIWNPTSIRMGIAFAIPFFTGAILILLLLKNQYFDLVMPMSLIFYGLSCINASKYTFGDVKYLGILEVILGLILIEFTGFGLLFWSLGFGVLHIIYGIIMYVKYDKK
jgi:hypothetical protein